MTPDAASCRFLARGSFLTAIIVRSGFGQEVDFGLSGIEARRRAPPQVDNLMAEYAYSRIVVKVVQGDLAVIVRKHSY